MPRRVPNGGQVTPHYRRRKSRYLVLMLTLLIALSLVGLLVIGMVLVLVMWRESDKLIREAAINAADEWAGEEHCNHCGDPKYRCSCIHIGGEG